MLAVAALAVPLVFVAGCTIKNENAFARDAGESWDFIEQLQGLYPVLPRGAAVFLVGTPRALHIFGDIHLNAVGRVYCGALEFNRSRRLTLRPSEWSGQSNAGVFRYAPR